MAFLPDRLREARKSLRDEGGREVSQDRFAELVGVSRRSPGRWENGESEPRMAQLARIVAVTGRPIGFFFDEPPAPTVVGKPEMMADLLRSFGETLIAQANAMEGVALPDGVEV